ncbi:uncharacterized protein METZ01_LOCUS23096 [marine metagenome]|uniref:Uncharacterized protein n=1 Tax=marine metagenome TaxID=408172 RepID=A0A381PT66_9ZZZZ
MVEGLSNGYHHGHQLPNRGNGEDQGAQHWKEMVPQVGFEPTTRCLEGSRSIP